MASDGTVLYPIWAAIDPETLDDPLRDELQWFLPLSVPVDRIASVADIPSIFDDLEPVVVVVVDEMEWFQPLSMPFLAQPSVVVGEFTADLVEPAPAFPTELFFRVPYPVRI